MVNARLRSVGCPVPFGHIEILFDGQVYLCCPTWLPTECGNVLTDTADELLNNANRLAILHGMRKGSFDHCTNHCPAIDQYQATGSGGLLSPLGHLDAKIAEYGYKIFLCYDRSCNLQCPSCRKGLIVVQPDDTEDPEAIKISRIHGNTKRLVNTLLSRGHRVSLSITGSGDAFASPLYWGYLRELAEDASPNLTLDLYTNGVLMTEGNMNAIRSLWPRISTINVSIDAATADTYRVVRKGGDFQKLVTNLANLDAMISRGDIPNLGNWQNNFVVQRDNFRELRAFVEWQLGYASLNYVATNLIAQWGHLGDDEYKGMAVWQVGHPMRDELRAILSDPIFGDRRVKLGNMSTLRSPA